jgi:succinate-semialdehyde dehydrogenase / glutarate-semialdehyde dehydrogenase
MQNATLVESLVGLDWGLFINGESVASSDSQTLKVYSPANNEVIANIAAASAQDVDNAVQNAQSAFLKWSKLTTYQRKATIEKATAYVRTQADRIGMLMALEQGKPFNQSRSEIIASCDTLDYYAEEGIRIEGVINPTEANNLRSMIQYSPVGVCALITPWNYPVSLLSWKLGPALASGCTMIVKPTTETPLSPMAFCIALTEGGIPAGVVNVLTGKGSVVGESLLRHKLVKKVAMTGSSNTGKRIMEVFAPSLNKVSLELGGQCPAIVCEDADLEQAAEVIIYKGIRNMGQSCSSVNRVYVAKSVQAKLVSIMKAKAEKMSMGDGVTDGSVDLGPMVQKSGVETVKEHIADALLKGATLVTGGKSPEGEQYAKGNYFLPTILNNCNSSMIVMQEETFGPVVPVESFNNLEDAIAKANDTNYGLVAYAFTKDMATTFRLAEALEAGTVCINNGKVNTNYAPYAGWKDSGYGVELSRKAIFEYLNTKHVKIEF